MCIPDHADHLPFNEVWEKSKGCLILTSDTTIRVTVSNLGGMDEGNCDLLFLHLSCYPIDQDSNSSTRVYESKSPHRERPRVGFVPYYPQINGFSLNKAETIYEKWRREAPNANEADWV